VRIVCFVCDVSTRVRRVEVCQTPSRGEERTPFYKLIKNVYIVAAERERELVYTLIMAIIIIASTL